MNPTAVDDGLARAASRGDERALAKIFRDYHQPLYRYCLSILGDRQDAEDALQETMVKVLRALPGEQREIALKPWLYRIAHNESIDLLRRRRENVPFGEDEGPSTAGLAEQVETRQRLRQLIADLGRLPERQRGTLLMREAGGLDFDEIAAALGTTPAVARQTLYEARLGLREMDAGRDMDCVAVTRALSDGDRRTLRRRDVRAHLRDCRDCRSFADRIDTRRSDLAAISPLPAAAAAAVLHGLLGGGSAGAAAAGGAGASGGTGSVGALVGGSAAKSIGTATLLKGAATVAVVAAIGVGAADKSGVIDFGGHGAASPTRPTRPASGPGDNAGAERGPQHRSAQTEGPAPGQSEAGTSPSHTSPAPTPKVHRSIGPAHATSPPPSRPAGTEATELPPEAPVTGASIGNANAGSPAPGKSGVEHPHGRGHVKQTPASAAHGKEVSSGPKAAGNGDAGPAHETESGASSPPAAADPVHPTHPVHPPHPAKPEKSTGPLAAETEEPASDAHGKKPK